MMGEMTNRTERLYESDSHIGEFDAVVLQCSVADLQSSHVQSSDANRMYYTVVLDCTCFFPEGGGQPADRGMLGDARVLDVHERDGVIFHITDRELKEGSPVHGSLDWSWRLSNMQQHSGEHIFSGIVHEKYGLDNVGFHIGSEFVTLDFNGFLTEEQLVEVERLANEAIYANLIVDARYPEPDELKHLTYRSKKELDGMIRIVTIPGCDRCACCGTHVKMTGEIGLIKLISVQKYKGGVRVSILCGSRALSYLHQALKSVDAISGLLSAKFGAVSDAVKQLQEETNLQKMKIRSIRGRLFEELAAKVDPKTAVYTHFDEDLTPEEVRQFALLLTQKVQTCAVFSGNDAEGYRYAFASSVGDMRKFAKLLNSTLNGRGGGTELLVQGSVQCTAADLRDFVNSVQ